MDKVFDKSKNLKKNIFITSQDITWIIIGIFGFFIGRIVIFDTLNPIAASYLSNFLTTTGAFNSVSIFLVFGFLLSFSTTYIFKYIICLALLVVTNFYLIKNNLRLNIYYKASIASICILASNIIILIIYSLSFYFYLLAVFETLLTFTTTILLDKSTKILLNKRRTKILSNEELISIALLFGGIIAGSSDIYVGEFSFKIIYSSLVILVIAYKGGSSLSATGGLILGLFLYLCGLSNITFPIILSITGIISGIFKEKHKLKVISAFILGGTLSILIFDHNLLEISLLLSCSLATFIFYILPQNFYFNLNSITNPNLYNSDNYLSHIREISNYKLTSVANTFDKLSKTFSGLSEKKNTLNKEDISKLINDVASKCCDECNLKDTCWNINFFDTYQAVFSILGNCEKKGKIDLNDLPKDFSATCIRLEKFIDTTNNFFELYKSNLTWHNAIVESRELISEQLLGVSNIIKSLATEVNVTLTFNEELEDNIILELNKNKLEVDKVIVLENKSGKYEITVTHNACYNKKNCSNNYISIISKIVGVKMKKENKFCNIENNKCTLKLVEEQKFRVTSGVSRVKKNGSHESGDSYSFMELKNGHCLLALSDGMGSGQKAREESAAAIDLLEDFIDSGFDKDTAVKIINSVLVLKSNDDSFSTLDICYINLYNGHAEFIKVGAAATFLLRDGIVHTMKSSSLPIGVLKNVDLDISSKILKENDIIVMVTDGLTEIPLQEEENNNWLINTIGSFGGRNPQDLSDKIISEAKKLSKLQISDDMTVLVTRIWTR